MGSGGENAEKRRILEARAGITDWRHWGPYVGDRQWGTVREDYSADQNAWASFPFDHARFRAYRWGEDGIAGICDSHQRLCFAFAFWNGADPFLKERYFGLTNDEGNHGEDVKEYYFYLDNLPTHAYMQALYKYPQREFPYQRLREENARRSRREPEFELIDTGIFDNDEYFDIFIEYAKAGPEDILVRVRAFNRGPQARELHVLPTLWFRNMWSWFDDSHVQIPWIELGGTSEGAAMHAYRDKMGSRYLYFEEGGEPLFTDYETNFAALWGQSNRTPYTTDGIDAYVVRGERGAVNPDRKGTKASIHYRRTIAPGESATLRLRLCDNREVAAPLGEGFDALFEQRKAEADQFYAHLRTAATTDELADVQRQAFSGLLWSKQLYLFSVFEWLTGDPAGPPPPESRWRGRNREWLHLFNYDVISMPDKWEYPWYASWDLAFQAMALAVVDPDFAKNQLELLTQEWYMHPSGQIPAYEWALGDVNPPVLALAALRVYQTQRDVFGTTDRDFLKRMFKKLALNFTWWVNRKDAEGKNVFQGGFMGLDNIGAIDRSAPLPPGFRLDQSDATSWMAMFCTTMMDIAGELSLRDPTYLDMFSKFLTHFIYIYAAVNRGGRTALWDERDGFYYDYMEFPSGERYPLRIRSAVGLVPLFAVSVGMPDGTGPLFKVKDRLTWMLARRKDLRGFSKTFTTVGPKGRAIASVVDRERLERILSRVFDEDEFLSPYGIRALSKAHERAPFELRTDGVNYRVGYEPAESESGLFGSNSNWRGPIWFPINYLIIRSLREYHKYFGDDFTMEYPARSGNRVTLDVAAGDLANRLMRIFLKDGNGRRPVFGECEKFQNDPHWRSHLLFYEYFHGDHAAGLGASHQTGWTALVANLIHEMNPEFYRDRSPAVEKELGTVSK
ncbi:MAG: glucosidase [Candidatus Eremiobacteraeota bacterium]|nr:glucosidase [Candidatus Eremiobacteraeota bacterium]